MPLLALRTYIRYVTHVTLCRYVMPLRYAVTYNRYVHPLRVQKFAAFDTPCTTYTPSDSSLLTETDTKQSSRYLLNSFLAARDLSPIRAQMTVSWEEASQRTKRRHVRKAKEVVFAVLEEIAQASTRILLQSVQSTAEDDGSADKTLMESLVDCYNNASHWSTRTQILSIMADKVSFPILKRWIPGLTRYRFNVARHHTLLHGRGSPVTVGKATRVRISADKLDHFLTFITSKSNHLPFGEKTMKLSSGTKTTVPNVVRTLLPEHVVQQYQSYCQETGFYPMSHSSLQNFECMQCFYKEIITRTGLLYRRWYKSLRCRPRSNGRLAL